MFSCGHFSPTNNFNTMSKRLMNEGKSREEERVVAKSENNVECSVVDCRSVSNSIGFKCISQLGHILNTKFEFGLHQYGKTRNEGVQ